MWYSSFSLPTRQRRILNVSTLTAPISIHPRRVESVIEPIRTVHISLRRSTLHHLLFVNPLAIFPLPHEVPDRICTAWSYSRCRRRGICGWREIRGSKLAGFADDELVVHGILWGRKIYSGREYWNLLKGKRGEDVEFGGYVPNACLVYCSEVAVQGDTPAFHQKTTSSPSAKGRSRCVLILMRSGEGR